MVRSKFNIFRSDSCQVWRKKGEALKLNNLNPTAKHSEGVMTSKEDFQKSGTT